MNTTMYLLYRRMDTGPYPPVPLLGDPLFYGMVICVSLFLYMVIKGIVQKKKQKALQKEEPQEL